MTNQNRSQGSMRYVAAVFFLLAPGLAASGYFYYAHQKKHIQQELRDELSAIADLKVDQITAWQKERLGDAEVFRSNEMFTSLAQQFISHPSNITLEKSLQ